MYNVIKVSDGSERVISSFRGKKEAKKFMKSLNSMHKVSSEMLPFSVYVPAFYMKKAESPEGEPRMAVCRVYIKDQNGLWYGSKTAEHFIMRPFINKESLKAMVLQGNNTPTMKDLVKGTKKFKKDRVYIKELDSSRKIAYAIFKSADKSKILTQFAKAAKKASMALGEME